MARTDFLMTNSGLIFLSIYRPNQTLRLTTLFYFCLSSNSVMESIGEKGTKMRTTLQKAIVIPTLRKLCALTFADALNKQPHNANICLSVLSASTVLLKLIPSLPDDVVLLLAPFLHYRWVCCCCCCC